MSLHTYGCPNCGEHFHIHSTAKAETCCYCRHLLQAKPELAAPDFQGIIPFGVAEDDAKDVLYHWQKGRLLTPYGFKGAKGLGTLYGVYLPVWLFNVPFTLDLTAKATVENTTINNNLSYVETNYYTITRKGEITFPHVPVNGFATPIVPWFDIVGAYDYAALVPFAEDYLLNHPAQTITTARELPDALSKELKKQAQARLERSIKGYNRVYDNHLALTPHDITSQSVLLPVWLSVFWYGKKPYGFILNGQKGDHYGLLPLSKIRLALLCAGAFTAMSSLCFLWGGQL